MELLNSSDAAALAELLMDDVPRAVLEMVCQRPGLTEGAIVGAITKQLPSTIESGIVRDRCISSLRWFLHNGDVATAGNRRYVIVPTYGIVKASQGQSIVRLCGDPRKDNEVTKLAIQLGCEFSAEPVPWYWQQNHNRKTLNIGLRRRITCPENVFVTMCNHLVSINIPLVDPALFDRNLPTIHGLTPPPRKVFERLIPNWGFRDSYNARSQQTDRWEAIAQPAEDYVLLRWRPSEDWRGEQDARYFYRIDLKHYVELTKSHAQMWMCFLDHSTNNSRNFWLRGQTIWTPAAIPETHQHWLQLLSEAWYREGELRRYRILTETSHVARRIEDTLGLQLIQSRPNRKSMED